MTYIFFRVHNINKYCKSFEKNRYLEIKGNQKILTNQFRVVA